MMLLSNKKTFNTYAIVNRSINDDKYRKIGTALEFQFLVVDSVQHSSKAESHNNRSAKQSLLGTLLLRHNQ